MKKTFLIFTLLLTTIPAFSANWIEVSPDNKNFVDTDSIREYNLSPQRKNLYSIWGKHLNDKTEEALSLEKSFKKKFWYGKAMTLFDCDRSELAVKSVTYYDLKENPIFTYTYKDYELKFEPIIPETTGEMAYNLICKE